MSSDRLRILKFLGLGIGCTAKFITGSLFVFNVYQDDLKAIFSYSQKEGISPSKMVASGDWIHLVDFSPCFSREKAFLTSCFFSASIGSEFFLF